MVRSPDPDSVDRSCTARYEGVSTCCLFTAHSNHHPPCPQQYMLLFLWGEIPTISVICCSAFQSERARCPLCTACPGPSSRILSRRPSRITRHPHACPVTRAIMRPVLLRCLITNRTVGPRHATVVAFDNGDGTMDAFLSEDLSIAAYHSQTGGIAGFTPQYRGLFIYAVLMVLIFPVTQAPPCS